MGSKTVICMPCGYFINPWALISILVALMHYSKVIRFIEFEDSLTELEIAVDHWPFSDQFSPFGRANLIC